VLFQLKEENYAPIEDEYDEAEEVSCPPIRAAKVSISKNCSGKNN